MPFKTLGLSDALVQAILANGYTTPTEIQKRAIPIAMEGKDILGCAQTGTGKTAAFVLPILNRLSKLHTPEHEAQGRRRMIRALILTPTRELCCQVEEFVRGYGRFTQIRSVAIYGGVGMAPQYHALRNGVDIVIATPGRLMDHMNRRSIDLSKVEIFVLDEADRMLDMGFVDDVRQIASVMSKNRQTLLFSATLSSEIKALAAGIQNHPHFIRVGEERRPTDNVTQKVYAMPQEQKMKFLFHMLEKEGMDSVLVFSRTKHGADKITSKLKEKGWHAAALHSDRTQGQRQQALEGFRKGYYKVLIATDIAARGIDVTGISHVINYDVPKFAEDYVHRIGRTGRASAKGDAITLVSPDEEKFLKKIEFFIGKKLERKREIGFSSTPHKNYVPEGQPPSTPETVRPAWKPRVDFKKNSRFFDKKPGHRNERDTPKTTPEMQHKKVHSHKTSPKGNDWLQRVSEQAKQKTPFHRKKTFFRKSRSS
jgi:ATP-dependent RNA helicase RhlE